VGETGVAQAYRAAEIPGGMGPSSPAGCGTP